LPLIRFAFTASAAAWFVVAASASPLKLVDPASVAPEFREAAQKRRAEQIRQQECSHKAEIGKIMPRERTAFVLRCMDEAAAQ
jgi:hypothetical protein